MMKGFNGLYIYTKGNTSYGFDLGVLSNKWGIVGIWG
jgi:hypothetical protein